MIGKYKNVIIFITAFLAIVDMCLMLRGFNPEFRSFVLFMAGFCIGKSRDWYG